MRQGTWLLAVVTLLLMLTDTAAAAVPPLDDDGKTSAVYDYGAAVRQRVFITLNSPFVDQDRNGTADRIAIDIIRPSESGPGNKVPAIIDPSPYYTTSCRGRETECMGDFDGDGVNDRWPLFYDNYFVPRGYAVILAQMNGTGYSNSGCPYHGGPGDIEGEKAVIDWLNGRDFGVDGAGNLVFADWHNGSSAMIGKSYDGTLANGVAATGVAGLKTIVPISAISDWYRYSRTGGIRHNTNYPGDLNLAVTNKLLAPPGVNLPDRRATCAPVNTDFDALDGDDTGDYNAFWDERDYTRDVANVRAAVFATHGFQDDNVRMDHLWEWWNGLEATGVPRKLWLLRSGHTDPFDARRAEWVDTLHRWFDHWLWGVDNGILDEPPVTIEDAKDVWGEYASWPVPGTADVPVYLQATTETEAGALRGVSGGPLDAVAFTNTSQGSGSSLGSSVETSAIGSPTGSQANRRVFLSRPLVEDVRLSGRAVVELQASLNATQSNLGAIVVDYAPTPFTQVTRSGDGVANTTTSTCLGVPAGPNERNCWREVSKPTQSVTQWRVTRGILDSSNRDSLRAASPVTVGQRYGYSIPMQPTEHTFEAGHQIGVVVVGNLYGIAGTPGAQITVDTKLSRVRLPVAGGEAAARASGLTDETAATTTASVSPAAGAAGWLRERPTVTLTADDGDGAGVKELTYATSGAAVTVAGDSASVPIGADGVTTVRFSSTDRAGNHEAEQSVAVRVDTTAPTVSCAGDASWHAANVTVACTATDAGSGLANPADAAFSLATAVAPGTADPAAPVGARTVCDAAGNCAGSPGSTYRVDRLAPTVTIGLPRTTFARGEKVRARYSCADGDSGVVSCDGPGRRLRTTVPGKRTLAVTVRDAVGNSHRETRRYKVLRALPRLSVKRRSGRGLRLALRSRVRSTVRITGTVARGGERTRLRPVRVRLQAGATEVVRVRLPRGRGRARVRLELASVSGALRRTDRAAWRLAR